MLWLEALVTVGLAIARSTQGSRLGWYGSNVLDIGLDIGSSLVVTPAFQTSSIPSLKIPDLKIPDLKNRMEQPNLGRGTWEGEGRSPDGR